MSNIKLKKLIVISLILVIQAIDVDADALEGIGVLMRYTDNPEKAKRIVSTILQKAPQASKAQSIQDIFTWIKKAEDAGAQNIPGFSRVVRTLGKSEIDTQGGYHVLDYAVNNLGINKIAKFEATDIIYGRRYDIVTIDGFIYELKNYSHYLNSNKYAILDQFKVDMAKLSDSQREKLIYVFRGSENLDGTTKLLESMQKAANEIIKDGTFKVQKDVNVILQNKGVPF